MSKFNEKTEKEQLVNHMGGKAFKQTPKEELAFAALTTFVEASYYEKKDDRLSRIQGLIKTVAEKDPEFVAKLAIYARTQFNMRSIFPVLVGELSKVSKGTDLIRKTVAKGTTRVDDLTELASYVGPKNIRTSMKKGIGDALNKFNEYQMAKYKAEDKDVSLVDLVNLTHPKAKNPATAIALKKLIAGELKNTDTWEAQMSAGKSAKDTFNDLLDSNKIGYMALLRNLRNIAKTGDEALIKKAAAFISNPQKVKESKQLPFRFLSAYSALEGSDGSPSDSIKFEKDVNGIEILKAAVNQALVASVQNIPLLSGRTMILSDNSGSMQGDGAGASVVSAMSKRSTADIANLFATLYWSRAENTMIGLFGDRLVQPTLNREKTIMENFKTVQREADKCGQSTEEGMFKCFEKLIKDKTIVDRIVIFSDCQVGRECKFYGTGPGKQAADFNKLFREYQKINPNVKVYSVDLKGYGNAMTTDEGVFKLTGWSDKIFDIMQNTEIAPGALVKVIEETEI